MRERDLQDAANQNRDEAEALRVTAEEWKQKTDSESKKRESVEAKLANSQKDARRLETEVEILKRVETELKSCLSRANKELEVAKSALHNAKGQYREVAEAVAPLVNTLAPGSRSIRHELLVARLKESTEGLRGYVRELASAYATHMLSLVKALYPAQDMKPFVTGRVAGVAAEEYSALEAQVEGTTDTIMDRLDF